MSLAFENALEVLFADPNIGVEAIYTSCRSGWIWRGMPNGRRPKCRG